MYLSSRALVLAAAWCLLNPVPGAAQDVPLFEISGGYSFLQAEMFTMNLDGTRGDGFGQALHGWVASMTGNLSPALGLTAEFGGNRWKAFGVHLQSLLAGPRVTVARARRVSLFAQVLLGAQRTSSALVPGESSSDFVIQPGVGLDVWMTPTVGLHVGADYRRVFANEASPLGGSSQFRLHGGLAVAGGRQ
jgi:hypothetical protein